MQAQKNLMLIVLFITYFVITVSVCLGEDTKSLPNQEAKDLVAEASLPDNNGSQSVEDPVMEVENLITRYLNNGYGARIRAKLDKEGGWYGYGIAEVNVNINSPQWAKFRSTAYQRALTEVQSKYIEYQYRNISATKIKTFLKGPEEVPDYKPEDIGDPGQLDMILKKLLALGEGKLDQMLDDLGIDKAQFEAKPKPQRYVSLRDSLMEKSLTEAFGRLAGFITIQTFEAFNTDGEDAIGVLGIVSPKLRQFADDILTARGQLKPLPNSGKDIYKFYSKNDKKLIDQFGVRKIRDREGYPVLVSFGQWSNSKQTTNRRLKRRYRRAAQEQARSIAESQIAFFLDGTLHFRSEEYRKELFQDVTDVYPDNFKDGKDVTGIVDRINQIIRARAKAGISGLRQLYTWTEEHPEYDHELVGTVLVWSPKDEKAARKLKDWKPNRDKMEAADEEPPMGTSGTKMGEEYMDVNDF